MHSTLENFARARAAREILRQENGRRISNVPGGDVAAGPAGGTTDASRPVMAVADCHSPAADDTMEKTNALRLLDGAGDGPEFAGLTIDDFAGRWLVSTTGSQIRASGPDSADLPRWLRQVEPPPLSIYWKRLDVEDKQPPSWWHGEKLEGPFEIIENGLRFLVDFNAGYSQGIFLDQRDNRAAVRARAGRGQIVLNCFAYTCGFSVAAAAGGAATVSVDLSNAALDWGKANFRANGFDSASSAGHEFYAGDVFDWMRRFEKKGRQFDLIVLDPPTFSRNRDGKIFRADRDFGRLAASAARLLTAGGQMFCSSNARGLSAAAFDDLLDSGLGRGEWRRQPARMPPDFTGQPYLRAAWLRRTK